MVGTVRLSSMVLRHDPPPVVFFVWEADGNKTQTLGVRVNRPPILSIIW